MTQILRMDMVLFGNTKLICVNLFDPPRVGADCVISVLIRVICVQLCSIVFKCYYLSVKIEPWKNTLT